MKVSKIGIYTNTTNTKVGNTEIKCINGQYKDKNISIYSEYENGKLIGKLYYVFDDIGHRILAKLTEIKDGKRINRREEQILK